MDLPNPYVNFELMYLSDMQAADQIWMGNQILEMVLLSFMMIILVYLVIRLPRYRFSTGAPDVSGKYRIKKSLEVYESVSNKLYQLLCFFSYSGIWTEIPPVKVFQIKAELDREMDAYGPLLSEATIGHYRNFVKMCFVSASGWEHELKIKSNYVLRKDHFPGWDDEWTHFFDNKNVADAVVLRETYHQFIDSFWQSLPESAS